MTGPAIALAAIILAILLGLAVNHYQRITLANRRANVAAEIKERRRKHKSVRHLYRKASELNKRELAS